MYKLEVYQELWDFLMDYRDHEYDFREKSYEECAQSTIIDYPPVFHQKVINQLEEVLAKAELPWLELRSAINYRFKSAEEARKWCEGTLEAIRKVKPQYGYYFLCSIPKDVYARLKKDYSNLTTFLDNFRDYNFSDAEIASRYKESVSAETICNIGVEGQDFLSQTEFPWEEVNRSAAEAFTKREDFRVWLKEMIAIIKL